MTLYDYIYVDLDKAVSLYSQITGGVIDLREVSDQQVHSEDNKRRYNLRVFQHHAGGTDEDRTASRIVIKPHHAILRELEEELAARGYLVDLTEPSEHLSLRDNGLRARLKKSLFLKVRGRAVIEDYERLKSITQVHPEIVKLINKSIEQSLKQSPDFIKLQTQLEQSALEIKRQKDGNARSRLQQQLKATQKSIDDLIIEQNRLGTVDQWISDGLKSWIDALLPSIVNLKVYPFTALPDEHVFGHLKKNCFQDADSNSFHFTYGSVPTEHLTMVGIVTSAPTENGDDFLPLAEFEKESLMDYESVESAFRGVFRGFDGLEQMIRTCRFPRVLVQALMVYRSVELTIPAPSPRSR